MTRRLAIAAAAATTLVLAAPATIARADTRHEVRGSWTSLVNCAVTSYDPISKRITCTGSTLWQGTWNGVTEYVLTGTYDPVTGDARGTLRETFRGSASDGSEGTLSFYETLTLDGATSQIHIDAHLVDGSGGFTGAHGEVTFDGIDNPATGNGTYAGWWQHL